MEVYCHKNRHKVMSKDDLRVIVLHLMMMIFFVQTAIKILCTWNYYFLSPSAASSYTLLNQ